MDAPRSRTTTQKKNSTLKNKKSCKSRVSVPNSVRNVSVTKSRAINKNAKKNSTLKKAATRSAVNKIASTMGKNKRRGGRSSSILKEDSVVDMSQNYQLRSNTTVPGWPNEKREHPLSCVSTKYLVISAIKRLRGPFNAGVTFAQIQTYIARLYKDDKRKFAARVRFAKIYIAKAVEKGNIIACNDLGCLTTYYISSFYNNLIKIAEGEPNEIVNAEYLLNNKSASKEMSRIALLNLK